MRKQRGSGWSIKLAFYAYKLFGYRFLYTLLYPIASFYYLFAGNVKKALRGYYERLGLAFSERLYFDHLRHFAICMTDRFASRIEEESYRFDFQDRAAFVEIAEGGCIVLLSHFGGWATASNRISNKKIKINIVMKEVIKEGIKKIENALAETQKSNINVIDLSEGGVSVAIKTASALMENEVVAMMGDRPVNAKNALRCKFLGREAFFNKNPFDIAYQTGKPIIVFFAIYQDVQHYKIEMHALSLRKELQRDEAVKIALCEYVGLLEKVVRQHPEQWFNLYDFWSGEIENES